MWKRALAIRKKNSFNIVEKLLHQPKTPVLPSAHSDQDLANAFFKEHPSFFPPVSAILSQTQPHKAPHCRLYMFEPTCVTCEITEVMKSPSKSCELDPVPMSLIKQYIDVFAKYITIIVNRSLSSGCFPDSQKVAHVNPLLKKPNLDKEVQELPTSSEFKVLWEKQSSELFHHEFLTMFVLITCRTHFSQPINHFRERKLLFSVSTMTSYLPWMMVKSLH